MWLGWAESHHLELDPLTLPPSKSSSSTPLLVHDYEYHLPIYIYMLVKSLLLSQVQAKIFSFSFLRMKKNKTMKREDVDRRRWPMKMLWNEIVCEEFYKKKKFHWFFRSLHNISCSCLTFTIIPVICDVGDEEDGCVRLRWTCLMFLQNFNVHRKWHTGNRGPITTIMAERGRRKRFTASGYFTIFCLYLFLLTKN